jgi:phosphate transport system protein
MIQTKHTLGRYDADLEAVHARILAMGGVAELQFRQALDALFEEDAVLARQAIDQDHRLNQLQAEIDRMCFAIIARHQPAANDLRLIVTSTKSVVHLKRIGDEVRKIAQVVERLALPRHLAVQNFLQIRSSARFAQNMLRDTLDCFARFDSRSAKQIIESDEWGKTESLSVLHHLTRFMADNPRAISASLEILMIARAIESIRHHIKTMSELVIEASNNKTTSFTQN